MGGGGHLDGQLFIYLKVPNINYIEHKTNIYHKKVKEVVRSLVFFVL